MNASKKFHSASLLIALASLTLSGCMAGIGDGARTDGINEVSCAEAVKTFETTGSVQPSLILTQLPAGVYSYASSEILFEETIVENPVNRVTRVQFLETPVIGRNVPTFSSGVRCRETVGRVDTFFDSVPVVTDFTVFTTRLYDFSLANYAFDFNPTLVPTLSHTDGGDVRSVPASEMMAAINRTWNAGYFFTRRVGNTYELHGTRINGELTVRVKTVYTRTDR